MWRKSSFSEGSGNSDCVEVAHRVEVVDIRDTKDSAAGTLSFSPRDWIAFVQAIDSVHKGH
jgi:hypothetical protein